MSECKKTTGKLCAVALSLVIGIGINVTLPSSDGSSSILANAAEIYLNNDANRFEYDDIPAAPESDFFVSSYSDGEVDGVMVQWYYGSESKLRIPETINGQPVIAITKDYFQGNQTITHLILPDTLLYAEHSCFYNCSNLEEIHLGSLKGGMEHHELSWLLHGCNKLTKISTSDDANFSLLTESDTSEFGLAFSERSYGGNSPLFYDSVRDNLKQIYIGSQMGDVSLDLFLGENLEWIEVGENNKRYSSYNGVLFSAEGKELVKCGSSYPGSYYAIPEGVESIMGYKSKYDTSAFYKCQNIKNIYISNTVKTIGAKAFLGCSNMKSIEIPSSVTSIGQYAVGYDVSYDYDISDDSKMPTKINDFTIYGKKGTAAEIYATKNGFTFVEIKEETPVIALGDTNADGNVNIADALMISRVDAGLTELNETQLSVSDVNHDGKVNIADALMISRYDAGLIENLA